MYAGVNPRNPNIFPNDFAKDTVIEVSFFHFANMNSAEAVEWARKSPVKPSLVVTIGTKPHKRVILY